MQRVFITFHIRKLLLALLMVIIFMVAISILIIGLEGKNSNLNNNTHNLDKIKQENDDIYLRKNSGEIKVKVYMAKEDKIVELSLEEYVRGVVAAEMPAVFGIEALKAQAVAVRTYVLSHMIEFGGDKCSIGKGADVCNTVHCQAYISKEDRYSQWKKEDADIYWDKITEAVKETSGKILSYDGKLVMDAYYFAMSSGKTENAAEVFAIDRPYLRSVESEGEKSVKDFETTYTYTYDKLASLINAGFPKAKVSSKKLKSQLTIISRTSGGGSVKSIKIGSLTLTGSDFRELLSLRSSNFRIVFDSKNVQVICKGYGHGVGMSQWGASIMAKEGSSYEKILTHYYQGVKIEQVENVNK